MLESKRKNSRKNPRDPTKLQFISLNPHLMWQEIIETSYTVNFCFFSGHLQSVPTCILCNHQEDCSAVIGKDYQKGKSGCVTPFTEICIWEQKIMNGCSSVPDSEMWLLVEKGMVQSSSSVPSVCMSCQKANKFSDAVISLFFDMKYLQFLPNTLYLILCAQTVESKVRYFCCLTFKG